MKGNDLTLGPALSSSLSGAIAAFVALLVLSAKYIIFT